MNYKKILLEVLMVVLFVAIAFFYFITPVTEGKVLTGVDNDAAVGSGIEMQAYRDSHDGERTRWTNSLFSGMPTYQMAPSYDSSDLLGKVETIYQLGLPSVVAYIFMMLLGFYIMLRCFNFKTWMAALGAILWAFSSYYFIIIAAGHIWKLLTLCFIPPTIGGMVLCYRGKYLWGTAVTGLFTALQIFSNHIQMTYYFLFVIGFMGLAFLINALRKKKDTEESQKDVEESQNSTESIFAASSTLKGFLKSTACFALGGILGVLVNLSTLYHTWEYSKETMRSKTELTHKTKDAADQTNDGLERSYITAWSYGGDEMLTLMVPDAKGGASVALGASKTAMAVAEADLSLTEMDAQLANYVAQSFPQYHGEQPGTSGPVYIGAFVCFLFILGMILCRRSTLVWCLFGATVLSILLSLGHNLMWFTDLFLDYVPMYDKFRTVASILVIAEFTMPLIGLLGLKKLTDNPSLLKQKNTKMALGISAALTAGVCLLLCIFPGIMGDFTSIGEHDMINQAVQAGQIDAGIGERMLYMAGQMRQAMFVSDCKRSFFIILLGCGALMLLRWKSKAAAPICVTAIAVICLGDMWLVNRRYLNNDNFTTPRPKTQMVEKSMADELILTDPGLYHRVMNLTVSTFNDNTTSAWHKSIGGYHAAKLRRYQEVIEAHLAGEAARIQQGVFRQREGDDLTKMSGDSLLIVLGERYRAMDSEMFTPVLNMLNMKYVIGAMTDPSGQKQLTVPLPVENPWSNGNAWLVDEVKYVDNADDELATISKVNTKHVAVANKQFKEMLGDSKADSTATVKLTQYEANALSYEVESKQGGVLVFSEIYYPGWTCQVDGKDVDIARVNYILRAIRIEGGKHQVTMAFDPQSVHTTDTIAYIALALLGLMLVAAVVLPFVRRKK